MKDTGRYAAYGLTGKIALVTGGAFPLVRSPSEEYPPEEFGEA